METHFPKPTFAQVSGHQSQSLTFWILSFRLQNFVVLTIPLFLVKRFRNQLQFFVLFFFLFHKNRSVLSLHLLGVGSGVGFGVGFFVGVRVGSDVLELSSSMLLLSSFWNGAPVTVYDNFEDPSLLIGGSNARWASNTFWRVGGGIHKRIP